MGQVAENVQLKHFSKDAFLRLMDYVISVITPRQIFFAQQKPIVRKSFEMHPGHVFDIPLSGEKHMIYGDGQELKESILTPGDIFYSTPLTWKRPLWDLTHEMACLVYNDKFIRFTYVDITEPPEPGKYPKSICFYHTQLPATEPICKLLTVLQGLAANGDLGNAALDITRGLFRLSREVLAADKAQTLSKSQLAFQRIQQYLHDNFRSNISREHVAHIFKLHPGYISALYQKNSSMTFSKTLHKFRMEHAAILLKNTDMLISEITGHCGYMSLTFFTAAFKKYFGMPPGKFRRQQWSRDKG